MKKKIFLQLTTEIQIRNFYETGLIEQLKKLFDIRIFLPAYLKNYPEVISLGQKEDIGFTEITEKRAKFIENLITLSWFEFRKRSNALAIKRNRIIKRKLYFFYILSTPTIVAKIIIKIFLLFVGINKNILTTLQKEKPDLVWIISSLNENTTIDVLKASKKLKIKTCVTVGGWDNLVTKGTVLIKPDVLAVWGKQHLEHAVTVQKMHPSRLRVVGVPAFETYFENINNSIKVKEDFYRLYRLNDNSKIILLGGSCYPFDEASALLRLDKHITSKNLNPHIKILYRPHPWGCVRTNEFHIEKLNLKNVILDIQVAPIYNKRFQGKEVVCERAEAPQLDYYSLLLQSISGCFSPYTTLLIEAAIHSIPIVALGYFDGVNNYVRGDMLLSFKHAKQFVELANIPIVKNIDDIEAKFDLLLEMSDDHIVKEKVRKAADYVVHHDNESCSKKMEIIINELL
ncbi:MAG: hypothetical protein HQK49_18620 [Oligoflexia bacterium]|nr:hypothetical protein [Oligoflexia bacterium]